MKQFTCGDVVPGCEASWQRDTEGEILAEVAADALETHGIDDVPPELVDRVRSRITTT